VTADDLGATAARQDVNVDDDPSVDGLQNAQ
jgi:hypothetical protein